MNVVPHILRALEATIKNYPGQNLQIDQMKVILAWWKNQWWPHLSQKQPSGGPPMKKTVSPGGSSTSEEFPFCNLSLPKGNITVGPP